MPQINKYVDLNLAGKRLLHKASRQKYNILCSYPIYDSYLVNDCTNLVVILSDLSSSWRGIFPYRFTIRQIKELLAGKTDSSISFIWELDASDK